MATGFDGVLFSVYPDSDGFLPLPAGPDNDNQPRTYSLDARLTSGSDLSTMRAKRSRVTILPAIGFADAGTLVIEGGLGVGELVYPSADGSEITRNAILVSHVPVGHMSETEYRVSLRFLIVE